MKKKASGLSGFSHHPNDDDEVTGRKNRNLVFVAKRALHTHRKGMFAYSSIHTLHLKRNKQLACSLRSLIHPKIPIHSSTSVPFRQQLKPKAFLIPRELFPANFIFSSNHVFCCCCHPSRDKEGDILPLVDFCFPVGNQEESLQIGFPRPVHGSPEPKLLFPAGSRGPP